MKYKYYRRTETGTIYRTLASDVTEYFNPEGGRWVSAFWFASGIHASKEFYRIPRNKARELVERAITRYLSQQKKLILKRLGEF